MPRAKTPTTFAARLRTLREAAGLSVAALATRAGTARQYLRELENGTKTTPGLDLRARLADALAAALGRPVSLDEFR